jgi:hypothetical protein
MRRAGRIACEELVELVTEYLDGALRPAARERIEGHLLQVSLNAAREVSSSAHRDAATGSRNS